MTHHSEQSREDELGPFQLFIFVLSIYVLIALFAQSAFRLPDGVNQILNHTDSLICVFFLADFFIRFKKAENKLKFMKWGWIDLLSSIPIVSVLLYGRVVRVICILRVLRALRSTKVILSYVFRKKQQGTLAVVSLVSVIFTVFGAIAILQVEKGIDHSNIQSAGDAIWWAFVTITTVGYGDYYPVTFEGRLVAAVLMTAGVGLFGSFTGLIASWLVQKTEEFPPETEQTVFTLQEEVSELRSEIQELKQLLRQNITGHQDSNDVPK